MLAAILYLMLPACGLNLRFIPQNCPAPAEERLALAAATEVLEDEIAQLEHSIAVADRACQPPPPPPPAPPPVAPQPIIAPPPPTTSAAGQRD